MPDQAPPILQPSIQVMPADPGQPVQVIRQAASSPLAGVLGVAIVSALAGYFVPKVMDRVMLGRRTDYELAEPEDY